MLIGLSEVFSNFTCTKVPISEIGEKPNIKKHLEKAQPGSLGLMYHPSTSTSKN